MKSTLITFLALSLSLPLSASWNRYPVISPDGSMIAFSAKGDLWIVPTTGGRAMQLTSNPAYDFMPVWSRDGKQIAFASNRYGNFDVYLVSSLGGNPVRLTFHSASDFPYSFSPDGKEVWFGSARLDDHRNAMFPSKVLHEIYAVSVRGGREQMKLSVPGEALQFSPDGQRLLMQDRKGYEDPWRKHHTSSVTRDIMMYDMREGKYTRQASWKGEDRNPVWAGEKEYYFLSEKSGSFNIWKGTTGGEAYAEQITKHEKHPVRFLSRANNGTLCYGYDGDVYVIENGTPRKVDIQLHADHTQNEVNYLNVNGGISEYALSPNGKEIAFVYRGEIYVSSVSHSATRRITNTSQQERSIHFSPDGRKLVYAAERNESWDIYESSIAEPTEKYFYNCTRVNEKALSTRPEEEFQPSYSPDGKMVAFLEERTNLRVMDLASGKIVTAMEGSYNYSYSDGDQYYTWSPDSKWLLVEFFEYDRWVTNVALVSAAGGKKPVNLSQSGYGNGSPKFIMGGEAVCWTTDKYGFRSHGSWGAEGDVEAIFLTGEAWRKFKMNKAEAEYETELEKEKKDEKPKETDKAKSTGNDKKPEEKKEEVKPIRIDEDGLQDRRARLTIHSSHLGDYLLNKDGSQLFYMSRFEKGYDIWTTKFKEGETKLLAKIGGGPSVMTFDKEEKFIFILKHGQLNKVEISNGQITPIAIEGTFEHRPEQERAYMFEHAWRQTKKKFYLEDLHGVDWNFYKKEYGKHLSEITTGYDFAELLAELLGELNASHTGATYRYYDPNGDNTASLACFYDETHAGEGYKIAEILPKSPLLQSGKIKAGVLITEIDGTVLTTGTNIYSLLNRKAGKSMLVTFKSGTETWKESIKPVSQGEENEMAYWRYVYNCEKEVEKLSGGKVGYVHVKGMDSESFREVYDRTLGKMNKCQAIIVDTRFNGGGWLHDDLATLLSGRNYMNFEPRGQKNMGGEPIWKWQKPSCVLMGEGNYSDAHLFPVTYRALGIGKLIGMPVPGTGTAVWWEFMIDGYTRFGIPQVGMRSVKDNHLVENQDLLPDIQVENDWNQVTKGVDQQLAAAVRELLK